MITFMLSEAHVQTINVLLLAVIAVEVENLSALSIKRKETYTQ
jgi:hypothetical protein